MTAPNVEGPSVESPSAPSAEVDADDNKPPVAPSVVEDMLKLFDKAVKARQLYLPNNPTYRKAVEVVQKALAPIWEETGHLVFQVTDTDLKWYGVTVNSHPDKSGDSVPWLLFKDGLRELMWMRGFEDEELEKFLSLIPKLRHAQPHEDDLLTLLWEQDFQYLRYRNVELSDPNAVSLQQDDAPLGRWPAPAGQTFESPGKVIEEVRGEVGGEGEGGGAGGEDAPATAGGTVRMEDFDSTLYFLDPHEIEYLKQETDREYALDLRRDALCMLLDIFELQTDPLVRAEVIGDLEALVLHLLTAGQFATVAFLLKEVEAVVPRARELRPADRERLSKLPDRLSNPETLSQMLQGLEESSTLPARDDLAQLFGQLKPEALAPLLDAIDRTQNLQLRPLLEGSAERLAQSNTSELVKLVSHAKPAVAREAIRRAGAMRTAAAVPGLSEVITSGADRPMRAAAVKALNDIGTPGAMSAIENALNDPERDIRLQAIRSLTARAHRPALARVQALVESKEARAADRTERLALFELYGTIAGDAGVSTLDPILNPRGGIFSKKDDPEFRACAALALGKINTEAAHASLQRASNEKDVIVRNAVSRALRGPERGGTPAGGTPT